MTGLPATMDIAAKDAARSFYDYRCAGTRMSLSRLEFRPLHSNFATLGAAILHLRRNRIEGPGSVA
jgi:hypothetical protein